jgi:hypothetical protein
MDLTTIILVAAAVAALVLVLLFRRGGERRIGLDSDRPEPARGRPDTAAPRPAPEPQRQDIAGSGLAPEDMAEIGDLLVRGRKIMAIKLVRERTGMNLRDAKAFVDYCAASGGRRTANPWEKRR